MTIATTITKNQWSGNGATTVFNFEFKIVATDLEALKVTLTSPLGVDTSLTRDTHYTVGSISDTGGTVTTTGLSAICGSAVLPTGWRITVYREVDVVQETDLQNQSAFYAETLEDALDYLTMVSQQVTEALARCVKLGITSTESADDIVTALTAASAAAVASAAAAASSASEAGVYVLAAAQSAAEAAQSAEDAAESAAAAGGVAPPTSNADEYVPQWDGADSAKLKDGFPISAVGKAFVAAATVAAAQQSVDLEVGVDVQPFSATTMNSAAAVPQPSADLTATGVLGSVTPGETVAFGQLGYLKSDGKYWLADADAASTMPGVVLFLEAKDADAACKALFVGWARNDAWSWTVGGMVFASTDSGGLTQAQPAGSGDQVQAVGVAYHADKIFFNPSLVTVEIS
jgi:hypothetical protein